MLKNVFKELIISVRRKYSICYLCGIVALVLLANIAVVAFRLIYGANEGTMAYNILEYATWCFVIPYYTCICIADIVFNSMKPDWKVPAKGSTDKCSGRIKLYLTKFISGLLLGLVYVVVATIVLIAITLLFHIGDGSMLTWYDISDFINKLALALPLWFAGVAMAMMFLFMMKSKKMAYISYLILTLAIPRTIMLMAAEPFEVGFAKFIRKYTITQNFSLIPYISNPERNVTLIIVLGIAVGILATVIGCVSFGRKKDSK